MSYKPPFTETIPLIPEYAVKKVKTKPPGMPESAWAASQGKSETSINPDYNTTSENPISQNPINDYLGEYERRESSNYEAAPEPATPAQPASGNKSGILGMNDVDAKASNIDTSKYSAANNVGYYNANNTGKETYSPNSTGKTNSGSGAQAALGTNFSWDEKAGKLAENAYQQEALKQKQNMLTQRQELEKNATQYQTQADMQKYTDNQTADKVGWTGGYVLDQERQREYMKQSIQAQLYGAMELQKYGYDTSMAAARLSYDANMMQYAEEYYNQAVQTAINEAQVTGVYFSAEVKDMLGQMKVAEAKLAENSDDERAQQVKKTINDWFSVNNISQEGIKTLEAWSTEQSLEMQWSQDLWTRYNAALESTSEDVSAYNKFYELDSDGNIAYDGTSVKVRNWDNMTPAEKMEYALSSDQAGAQLQSYIEGEVRSKVNSYVASVTDATTGKKNINATDLTNVITDAINSATKDLKSIAKGLTNEEDQKKAAAYLNAFDANFADRLLKEQAPTETYNNEKIKEETRIENNSAKVSDILNKIKESSNNNSYEIKLDTDAKALSRNAAEKEFGEFNGTGEKNDSQSIWVNSMQKAAQENKIPDGTVVNMNVGAGKSALYMYSDGYWYKFTTSNNTIVEQYLKDNGLNYYSAIADSTAYSIINSIMGYDYVSEYKKANK
jgi:hypothetical protein